MQKATQETGYIKIIKDGEEFRRYSADHWEHHFLSDDFEQVPWPFFLELNFQGFVKSNKIEDK